MADESAAQEVELVVDTSQPQVMAMGSEEAAAAAAPEAEEAAPVAEAAPSAASAGAVAPSAASAGAVAPASAEAVAPASAEAVAPAEAAAPAEGAPQAAAKPPAEPAPPAEEPPAEKEGAPEEGAPSGEPTPSGAPIQISSKMSATAPPSSEIKVGLQSQQSVKNISFDRLQSSSKTVASGGELKKSRTESQYRLSRRNLSKDLPDSRAKFSSIWSIKRGSIGGYEERQKAPKFMNTYKLDSEKPFNPDRVYSIIVEVVEELMSEEHLTYNAESCANKAKLVSETIRNKVKVEEYERFKIICLVTIGEKKSYDIFSCVRFLWDSDRDAHASYFQENMYIYITASVYGIYYE